MSLNSSDGTTNETAGAPLNLEYLTSAKVAEILGPFADYEKRAHTFLELIKRPVSFALQY